jgi:hypothetical protein
VDRGCPYEGPCREISVAQADLRMTVHHKQTRVSLTQRRLTGCIEFGAIFVFDQLFNCAGQDRKTAETAFRFEEEDLVLDDWIPNKVVLSIP